MYHNFGQLMTLYMLSAVDHLNAATDPDTILEHMDRLRNFIQAGTITPEQYGQIKSALEDKTGYIVPEDTDTDSITFNDLVESVNNHDDALAEIGVTVSDHDDAIAELGEEFSDHDNAISELGGLISEMLVPGGE